MSSQLAKSAKSIKNHHRPINQKKRPLMILPARFFPYICRHCFEYIDTDRWFGHPSPMGGEGNHKSNLWKMEPTDIDYVVVVGGIAEMWWQIMKTQKHGRYLSQSQSLLSDVWFVSHCLANLCRFFIMDMVAFMQGGKGHLFGLFGLASASKGPRLVMDWSAVSQVNYHVCGTNCPLEAFGGKNCPFSDFWWQWLVAWCLRKIRDRIKFMGFNLFAKWDAWHGMDGNVSLPNQRGYGPKCVNRVS